MKPKRCCSCSKSYARERGMANACNWSKSKFERCVKKVKRKGQANPYAVCNSVCLGY
jgi:hypothetical protein